jgi:hypothetical protein
MDLDQVRIEMKQWAEDLETLRPFVDSGMEGPNQVITAAWNAAKERFENAVTQYAQLITNAG